LAIASNLDIIVLHVLQHPPVEREIGLETMDFPIKYGAFIWIFKKKTLQPILGFFNKVV